ncbi:DUF7835 family putative zinc beta-ribbon protein [Halegenticoccus soli]|uniref:DUF7835 family putative zinc beta-ribbon protein n=1 Tax=Halegenticoccus soli TaxID=1985678 RepID=UPI000C6D01E4|nr:hypothetical protein [Halegenticoccus soli]
MPERDLPPNAIVTYCDRCDRNTVHEVSLELESTTDGADVTAENAKFAKSPARRTVCCVCGARAHRERCAYE